MYTRKNVVALVALCSLFMAAWLEAREPARPLAEMAVGASRIDWQPAGDTGRLVLTVAGPEGLWLRKEFEAGQPAFLSLSDRERFPNGAYTYELRPGSGQVQSGHFSIKNGSFVTAPPKPPLRNVTANLTDDELIIQGNACIGEECTTSDDDFPVLRLKGQNPNILFDDVEGPPSLLSSSFNDWAIRINASDVAKFSIFDVDGESTPFSILGGAPDNSLFIRDNGNVGIGTATPAAKLEVSGGEVRLPAGSSLGGFTHFNYSGDGKNYIRGITVLADNGGWVGIGTASPVTKLHVSGSSVSTTAPTKILVQETSSTTAPRELLEIQNKGAAVFIIDDTTVPERWAIGTFGSSLVFDNQATTGLEMTLGSTGNLTIAGTLTQGSDRFTKTAIIPVRPEEVLEKLASLPISTWSRKDENPKVRHLGPMAQDFSAIFGLGEDDRHIAPLDMAGVSMASVQALHGKMTREMAEKDAEIAALRERLVALEELVSKLAPQ